MKVNISKYLSLFITTVKDIAEPLSYLLFHKVQKTEAMVSWFLGETTIEKSQRINFTFYTNRTFETLVGSKDGRKYDLLLSFTHNNKDVYAHLGYNNQDYRVGELTITKQEKPQPTPNIMHGDIALNTAYFAQGGLWLGSDNSTISARFTTVKCAILFIQRMDITEEYVSM